MEEGARKTLRRRCNIRSSVQACRLSLANEVQATQRSSGIWLNGRLHDPLSEPDCHYSPLRLVSEIDELELGAVLGRCLGAEGCRIVPADVPHLVCSSLRKRSVWICRCLDSGSIRVPWQKIHRRS